MLTEEEEEKLPTYLVQMSDMGFGISREGVMGLAYNIAQKSKHSHPFSKGSAGRAWYEGFMKRHPKVTIRSPQPLSYCRAPTKIHSMTFLVNLAPFMEDLI